MDHDLRFKEFEKLLAAESYRGIRDMNTTWYERGRTEASLEIAQDLLRTRFGALPANSRARLQAFSADQLSTLIKQIIKADSLRELGLEE